MLKFCISHVSRAVYRDLLKSDRGMLSKNKCSSCNISPFLQALKLTNPQHNFCYCLLKKVTQNEKKNDFLYNNFNFFLIYSMSNIVQNKINKVFLNLFFNYALGQEA